MTIPLLGYVDKLSARPGDTLGFKVSSTSDSPYEASLERVVCADPNPDGPGLITHPVPSSIDASYPSREQPFFPGSHVNVAFDEAMSLPATFSTTLTMWPTLPLQSGQVVLSMAFDDGTRMSIEIGDGGMLRVRIGDTTVTADIALRPRAWYDVAVCVDADHDRITLTQRAVRHSADTVNEWNAAASVPARHVNAVCMAGLVGDTPSQHFNGKLEAPAIWQGVVSVTEPGADVGDAKPLCRWDFRIDIPTLRIVDTSPGQHHGRLVNLAARAMTGSRWDGREMCWRHDAEQYGAIHFHDDDIYDFEWESDFEWVVPDNLPSGVYAIRIHCKDYEDAIPFFICPPRRKPSAKLCVLVSTITYAIYGNHARPDFKPAWKDKMASWGAYPWNSAEHRSYGLSTYNFHTDGSGVCHASHRRPLFTLRPGYLTFCNHPGEGSGLRHFQADSHLISWLEAKEIDYDLVTDNELHQDGVDAIKDYDALMTGSHPEYHTRETLDAIEQFRDAGGNLIYLGGNGFYWKVALHTEQQGAIEIRRAEGGIRAWAAEPGEYYNAFDGEYGGLWRRNGRPPQRLAGVGFSAQGTFLGSYYRRGPGADDPRAAWIFEGIDDDIIGDFGLCGGGAAGFELDRVDERLGTPPETIVLASSENHADTFVMVPEEHLTHITTWSGLPAAEVIRADMIYAELPGGGKLFSTGSITFCGSLPANDFDNNVSQLLENVVKRFAG